MSSNINLTEKAQRDILLVVDAIENGNQQAYAKLLNYYRDPIYFMILKLCNNPHDAEDLTVEAFSKAFKNLHQYTHEYAFSTWLFRIASNNCIDFLRRKNRAVQCLDDDIENFEYIENIYPFISTPNNPEETFIDKQRVKMLHGAVAQLRPKYQALIKLRYFEEYSYEEIANELGISINNVKIQLFRAKDMLSVLMEKIKYTI